MGLEHHARITEDAEARILKEASDSSYRKGGMNASINGGAISKEAVMPRIIYVYEGVESDEGGRPGLINPRYFGVFMMGRKR